MNKEYKPSEIDNLKIHGRTTGSKDPITLFWTASGIEMNYKGSELRIRYHADYNQYEPWINVVVNGVRYQKRPLEKGTHEITVWKSAESINGVEAPIRNIRIIRDTPAMAGDGDTLFQIEAIIGEGTFEPIEEPKLRMEFIGDSITSGEGGIGPVYEEDWNSGCFDCVDNYAYKTASELGADYNVYSQSGWGICWSWNGNPGENMPGYYDQICGLVPTGRATEAGAHEMWDFDSFKTDIVVINLGTNDIGAFQPESHDAAKAMGSVNEHDLDEQGLIPCVDADALKSGVKNFLTHLRQKNPQAKLIWVYGMLEQNSKALNDQMRDILEGAVEEYSQDTDDKDVCYLQLPVTKGDGFGSRAHPGHKSHENAAACLVKKIREFM